MHHNGCPETEQPRMPLPSRAAASRRIRDNAGIRGGRHCPAVWRACAPVPHRLDGACSRACGQGSNSARNFEIMGIEPYNTPGMGRDRRYLRRIVM